MKIRSNDGAVYGKQDSNPFMKMLQILVLLTRREKIDKTHDVLIADNYANIEAISSFSCCLYG